jgi:hypothetical protein
MQKHNNEYPIKMAVTSPESLDECIENIIIPALGRMKKQPDYKCSCKDQSDACLTACIESLILHIAMRLTQTGKVAHVCGFCELEEFLMVIEKDGLGECGVCCICGEHYIFWGNNPTPVFAGENNRCCHLCNRTVVVPARIKAMGLKSV